MFVHRLVVRDTIEDRYVLRRRFCCTTDLPPRSMLRLQTTKRGLAEAALGEGGTIKLHKLSVKELKAVGCSPDSTRILFDPSDCPFTAVVWNEPKRGP